MRTITQQLLKEIKEQLLSKKLTIATAESCTGGLVAHTLTNISGSSAYFERGHITYSNKSKIETLEVPEILIKKYGAVSPEVAASMAEGVRITAQTSIGLSTTGIAGPTGGAKEKAVGLVYIGIATPTKTEVKNFLFKGSRLQNKKSTLNATLTLLLKELKNW